MANVNPGPAVTSTEPSVGVLTRVNLGPSSSTISQGSNALRLLGRITGLSLNATGDAAVLSLINVSRWAPVSIITSNANGDIHLAALGVFTAAAAGGTAVLSNGALTSQTTATYVKVQAATAATTSFTGQTLYVNVGTASAGGTCDLFILGYDLSS